LGSTDTHSTQVNDYFFFVGFGLCFAWARSDPAISFCFAVDLGLLRTLLASDAGFFPVVMKLLLAWWSGSGNIHRCGERANGASIRFMPFMLDTCAINRIFDGSAGNEWSLRGDIFVTDIQLHKILDTANPIRRDYLFSRLIDLRPKVIRPRDMFQMLDGSVINAAGPRPAAPALTCSLWPTSGTTKTA
jgi:hypothetical protein